jgi:hypothetical protein
MLYTNMNKPKIIIDVYISIMVYSVFSTCSNLAINKYYNAVVSGGATFG